MSCCASVAAHSSASPRSADALGVWATNSPWPATCGSRVVRRRSSVIPEIGVGLPPGGGALEWLPRLVGRSRALEIVLSGDDFDADVAERYGWVNRALDDDDLDAFVDKLAARLATFDRQALGAVKAQINRVGVPTGAEVESSNQMFFAALAWPGPMTRRAKLAEMGGYGARSDLELNFGRFLPSLGPVSAETFSG